MISRVFNVRTHVYNKARGNHGDTGTHLGVYIGRHIDTVDCMKLWKQAAC